MTKARNIADLGSNDVIETTATGVDVTGTVTADGLTVEGNSYVGAGNYFTDTTSGYFFGGNGSYANGIYGYGVNNCRISTDGKSRITIDSGGDVSFYEDTGTTAKMVWSSSAERLELGTSSGYTPVSTLAINETINTPAIEIIPTADNNNANTASIRLWGTTFGTTNRHSEIRNVTDGSTANNELAFDTNGTERLRIDSAGNVGIGTASPSETLTVVDSDSIYKGSIKFGETDSYFASIVQDAIVDGGVIYNSHAAVGTTHGHKFHINGTERARIDSSGNFGIGTSNPAYKLVVSDSGGAGLEVIPETSNNKVFLLSYDRTNTGYRQMDLVGSELIFSINTEKARIASNGNLLVGTTNSPSVTSSLSVAGRMYSAGTYANNSGAGANLGIASSGEIYRSTSSLRYKTDVQDAQHGLTEVMTLRPVTYRGINDGDTVFGGLIAEEVHDAGLTEFVEYNEDNEPDALAYANMVSLCIKAIQEQQEIIENLKSRIETLENN